MGFSILSYRLCFCFVSSVTVIPLLFQLVVIQYLVVDVHSTFALIERVRVVPTFLPSLSLLHSTLINLYNPVSPPRSTFNVHNDSRNDWEQEEERGFDHLRRVGQIWQIYSTTETV